MDNRESYVDKIVDRRLEKLKCVKSGKLIYTGSPGVKYKSLTFAGFINFSLIIVKSPPQANVLNLYFQVLL